MDREEIIEFLKENLSIEIDRNQDYYSYPHLEVKLKLENQIISSCITTIYDGERS